MRINNYKKRIYENRYSCSGQVGQVLAKAFLHEGHEVMLGTRNTAKEEVVKWKTANPKGQTGNFEETAKFGELLSWLRVVTKLKTWVK